MSHKSKKLLWQIYPSYLLIIGICVVTACTYAFTSLKSSFYSQVKDSLYEKSELFSPQVKDKLISGAPSTSLDTMCVDSGSRARVRFTIIDIDGDVIGDTEEDPSKMENHKERPEIRSAFIGNVGSEIRYSETLKQDMMYVSIPVYKGNEIISILRTSVSLESINKELLKTNWNIIIVGVIISGIATLISLFFTRKITKPIIDMKEGAKQFASGKLSTKLYIPEIDELAGLARTLNQMSDELSERLKTESRNRNELETVFLSMREGVLALDNEERIMRLNQSALDMLSMKITDIKDKNVYEIVRDSDLYKFIEHSVESSKPYSSDLKYGKDRERILNAQSSPLRDENGERMGTLFVIQDVTKIRHLENMRRDFVANVSHELKTPMTAIKGFVETIRESGDIEQEKLERFLSIIDKNVDRLINIINDLLDLSWIEKNEQAEHIRFRKEDIKNITESVVKVCETVAKKKNIKIVTNSSENFEINVNRVLFENALTNLIDNAVKYSDEGKVVEINTRQTQTEAMISVKDQGIGIPSFEYQRIFERFYRVDKGRSRKMGGTGLGLSIVKHVMNIHKGRVELDSTPGVGSTFTLIIPL